jgi:ubiquinone/menaquinone biosynthesis C-methylase UbiE
MKSEKLILDACCGGRMFWFDKNNPDVLFCDNREFEGEIWQSKDGTQHRHISIKPDILADFTSLPFKDKSFRLVVFDPPHLVSAGETAWMVKKYGRLPEDWERQLNKGFSECMRVLMEYGVLIFKWNETQISVSHILKVIGKEPLFGHKSGKQSKTHWMCFMKKGEG